jgi:hypothetical protein
MVTELAFVSDKVGGNWTDDEKPKLALNTFVTVLASLPMRRRHRQPSGVNRQNTPELRSHIHAVRQCDHCDDDFGHRLLPIGSRETKIRVFFESKIPTVALTKSWRNVLLSSKFQL